MQEQTCGNCSFGRKMFINDKRIVCGAPLFTNGFIMQPNQLEKEQCKEYKKNQLEKQ